MTGSWKLTSTTDETSPLPWLANVYGGLVAPAIYRIVMDHEPFIASRSMLPATWNCNVEIGDGYLKPPRDGNS